MTGFKLHYPPGFVDRAYLVFLVAVTNSPNYWLATVLESLSPPCRLESSAPALSRGTSPVAPGRHHDDCFVSSASGKSSGGPWTAPSFRPRPPGGACPCFKFAVVRTRSRIRGNHRAGDMPTLRRGQA
jgi:hypothetical protein